MAPSTYTIGGNIQNRRVYQDIVIRNGESLSDIVDMGGLHLLQIIMPAAWTAAALTFLMGKVSTAMKSFYDGTNTEASVAVPVVSSVWDMPSEYIFAAQCIQLRSGTAALAVNQNADRTFTLVFEEV